MYKMSLNLFLTQYFDHWLPHSYGAIPKPPAISKLFSICVSA